MNCGPLSLGVNRIFDREQKNKVAINLHRCSHRATGHLYSLRDGYGENPLVSKSDHTDTSKYIYSSSPKNEMF